MTSLKSNTQFQKTISGTHNQVSEQGFFTTPKLIAQQYIERKKK